MRNREFDAVIWLAAGVIAALVAAFYVGTLVGQIQCRTDDARALAALGGVGNGCG